jgi:hypothetical protein
MLPPGRKTVQFPEFALPCLRLGPCLQTAFSNASLPSDPDSAVWKLAEANEGAPNIFQGWTASRIEKFPAKRFPTINMRLMCVSEQSILLLKVILIAV